MRGATMEMDCERQIQIVEDVIARKVDGIVLAAGNRKALAPAVEKIYDRKIPCVVDSGVETDKYLSYLATDNRKGGGLLLPTFGGIATRPRDSVTPGKDFL
jgi:ribose transport system substrate-binding protein